MGIEAGLVGNQTNPPGAGLAQSFEVVLFQDIDPGRHAGVARQDAPSRGIGFVVAGDLRQPQLVGFVHGEIEGRSNGGGEASAQGNHVAVVVHGIGQQDDVGLCGGIDPQRCAGKTGVPKAAHGKQFTAIGSVGRIDVPSKAAQNRLRLRLLRGGHLLNRQRRPDLAVVIEKRLGELGEVISSRKHAGMPGDAAHLAGGRIVHDASQQLTGMRIHLCGRDLVAPLGRREIGGVLHPQGPEDLFFRIAV